MDGGFYIFYSRWARIAWNGVLAIGVGLDPQSLVIALYLGPVSVYLGYSEGVDDDDA